MPTHWIAGLVNLPSSMVRSAREGTRRLDAALFRELKKRLIERQCQGLLEFEMDLERAVQEPGSGTAGAVFLDGRTGGFLDFGVVGQAQVTVGPEHEDRFAIDNHLCVLR